MTIRNNKFVNCSRGLDPYLIVIKTSGLMGKEISPYYHNIHIYDNVLSRNGKALIDINYTSDVHIKNNAYICNSSQPEHENVNEAGVRLDKCENLIIE